MRRSEPNWDFNHDADRNVNFYMTSRRLYMSKTIAELQGMLEGTLKRRDKTQQAEIEEEILSRVIKNASK
jgi:hypothetical protein